MRAAAGRLLLARPRGRLCAAARQTLLDDSSRAVPWAAPPRSRFLSSLRIPASVEALAQQLDFDTTDLARVLRRHPPLASLSAEEVTAGLAFLRDEAGLSDQRALASAVRQHPELLTTRIDVALDPALASVRAMFPKAGSAAAIVRDCPEVLLRPPGALAELRDAFGSMGIPWSQVVKRTPRVLTVDAAAIRQIYDFFVDAEVGPGLAPERAGRLLGSYPMLIVGTRSPKRQLAPLVRFLREELGVDPASEACLAFYAWPDSLGLVEANVRFLTESCGFTLEALREGVSYLGHSLEARIRPRSAYAQRLGAARPSLRALTAIDDKAFCEEVIGANLFEYRELARELRKSGTPPA